MSQKALVTGASGMLGRALVRKLSQSNETIGTSQSGRSSTLASDLSNRDSVQKLISKSVPSFVIHTAAYSDVDGCEKDPLKSRQMNALMTRYLAEECAAKNIPFIHVSTDYVFGGQEKTEPYSEDNPTSPVNIYGLTKLEGEYYTANSGGNSVIVRTSWLFGDGNPANFVNVMREKLKTEERLAVLDDQKSSPTYVVDLAAALEKIALSAIENKKKTCPIYHFCNKGVTTRHEMTEKMRDYMGLDHVRVDVFERSMIRGRLAVRPTWSALSTALYERTFGEKIRPWKEALKEYLDTQK